MDIILVFRKTTKLFHSIENVFNVLNPFLNTRKLELPFESRGIKKRLKNIQFLRCEKKDVIHITGHDHYLLWWPFKKTILTIHDIEALKRKKGFRKWLFQKLWFDWPIENATIITTISEFSKKEILSMRNYKTPIVVISNPLTLPLNYEPKKFNQENPRILHIGTKENKNLKRLLEAFKTIKSTLVIVGELPSEQKIFIKKNALTVESKFNLSNEEMVDEYRKCDILSFVSTYEGFGLPILEAQAIGRAVITSNVASMPEVAGKGALLVNPFNVEEIRDGIRRLIVDEVFREKLIKIGLENVKRFEVETIAKQYNSIYQKIGNEL